ncbi:MAG: hypothetical protein L3J59_02820 [Methylococcaceae bacterium]|nr:hypothetical protein [Methylococcaceae bacterium]
MPFILIVTSGVSQTTQASNDFWSNVAVHIVANHLTTARYYPKKCDREYRDRCYKRTGYARRACFRNRQYSSNNRRHEDYPRFPDNARNYNNRRYNTKRGYSSDY